MSNFLEPCPSCWAGSTLSSRNSVSNHWLSISLKNAEEADGTMIAMDYFSLVGK